MPSFTCRPRPAATALSVRSIRVVLTTRLTTLPTALQSPARSWSPRRSPGRPSARALPAVLGLVALVAVVGLAGCSASSHEARPADLGVAVAGDAVIALAARPGPLRVRRVTAAHWAVPRSGLIDLEHPVARAAGLDDGPEPIEVSVWVVDHPREGRWLIDSGVAAALGSADDGRWIAAPVRWAMDTGALDVRVRTRELDTEQRPVAGVLLTHIHLDHILGLPDLAPEVPVFTGPGETSPRSLENLATRGTTDRLLGVDRVLRSWRFAPDPDGRFAGALDVFGDGSLIALHVPGHTPGSTAFLARAEDGVHLITGDASHTAWGWTNGVPPGTYSLDPGRAAASLETLRALTDAVPSIRVHPGHQRLAAH